MGVRRIAGEAKETVRNETDERVKVARLLVMRDTMIAAAIAAAIAAVIIVLNMPTPAHPHRIAWFFLFPVLIIAVVAVAGISSRRHKSTTPEMDRARAVQTLLAVPGVIVVGALIIWAVAGDLGSAIEAGVYGGLGVVVAAVLTYWKSRRG